MRGIKGDAFPHLLNQLALDADCLDADYDSSFLPLLVSRLAPAAVPFPFLLSIRQPGSSAEGAPLLESLVPRLPFLLDSSFSSGC